MNNLQKVELELFKVFKETCEKLNLKYFLTCGTALGAARHGGFIPWDDDMDVGMFREDYNKFMELAPALLPEGIFLQNHKTDPQYRNIAAKLRNSNTTYIEKSAQDLDINHGVYLDIFPLDGYPDKPWQQKKLALQRKWYIRQLASSYTPRTLRGKIVSFPFRLFCVQHRTAKIVDKYSKAISKYAVKDSKRICNHGTWHGSSDFIPSAFYGNGTEVLYEGVTARAPEQLDQYLTHLYGDWRQLPPPEKQKGHHFYEICDTEKPYTFYMNKK